MFKWLLDLLKPPVASLVSQLKTNRDANIATIESKIGEGGATVESAVTGFLTNEAKQNAELGIIVPLVEPALLTALNAAIAEGNTTVPALYDKGVAWLEHEESVL